MANTTEPLEADANRVRNSRDHRTNKDRVWVKVELCVPISYRLLLVVLVVLVAVAFAREPTGRVTEEIDHRSGGIVEIVLEMLVVQDPDETSKMSSTAP